MSDEKEMPKGHVVALEVAEAEFSRFAETMDFNLDPSGWDDEEKKSFNDLRSTVVIAIEKGRITINDNGEPVFKPSEGEDLTFHEPRGRHLTATDLKKAGHLVAKQNLMMAQMTGKPIQLFENMVYRDYKVCTSIVALFLGSK